ncbi:MAG: methionyl-tRNA formyltransferase [Kiritimatiellae bacterium]|nr:methionyl-tRNA formyltransferase [Kiritimatiellia bacterium]
MRIVFMGSSEASSRTLGYILRFPEFQVVGVVTQPDRPCGRRQKFMPCPCKAFAMERRLKPIITPEKVNAPEVLDQIRALKPDVIVVVAFGQFLGKTLLEIPPLGCINGHFSMLPKYRGASPVQSAIAAGERETGVTIMQMGLKMDEGDILLQRIEPICCDDTGAALMDRLAFLSATLMVQVLNQMRNGPLLHIPQNPSLATYAPKIQKNDGLLDWTLPAVALDCRIRAFNNWPGAFTYMPIRHAKGKQLLGKRIRVKILKVNVIHDEAQWPENYDSYEPGTVCGFSKSGMPLVRTTGRPMELALLQPDGGKVMDGKSFLNGHPLLEGDKFYSAPDDTTPVPTEEDTE